MDRPGRLANRLVHTDLAILDELGYLPFSQVHIPVQREHLFWRNVDADAVST